MKEVLIVGGAGAIGAVARYLMSAWVHDLAGHRMPWGTLAVNVLGCFLLGYLMHATLAKPDLSPHWRLALATGFLGAFTTFSTFSYETVREIENGALHAAGLHIALNLALGIPATFAGLYLARQVH